MIITKSFLGELSGAYKYRFHVLLADYTDLKTEFIQEFQVRLERLARSIGPNAAVVQPFPPDIEQARGDVFDKAWTEEEQFELGKVPSLLLITTDFAAFSPREHPWMLFHFGEARFGTAQGHGELAEVLDEIAAIVTGEADGMADLFELAREVAQDPMDLATVFKAQPGVFGFSVDLVRGGQQFLAWLRSRQMDVGRI